MRVENTFVLGQFLRDVMRENMGNFRVFGPDETASNRLQAIYEVTQKTWLAETRPEDSDGGRLSPDGRVMEMLSEHTLEGWMEGYLLTGRHGLFSTYEAFAHVIDSMVNQHAKWLDKCKIEVRWRAPVSSLNLLISSTVWRQDHNGFTHQDPGFIDVVTNKSPTVTRIYLPPDANCLLSVGDHCLRSTDYINVIVADKQPHLQYLDMDSRHPPLHQGHRPVGLGQQRSGRRARRGDGQRGRRGYDGGAGGGRHPAPEASRSQDSLRQRGRSVQAAAPQRASARHDRPRFRQPVHHQGSRSFSIFTAIRG